VRFTTIITIAILLSLPNFPQTNTFVHPKNVLPFTIVIDAGHGGKDSGALGSTTKEKDITLKLALKLGAYINKYLPKVRVIYTRTKDVFAPLHKRTALANANHADVFFSIHCNAMMGKKGTVNGTETFVMGLHRAEENLNVAKRENKTILLEKDYARNYGGYDPNSLEAHIMLSMYQHAHLSQSLLLAEKVEGQFKSYAKRRSRGVKQAGFVVLRATTMPSILVETGFLTNKNDENYLKSEKGQVYLAAAMYRAIKNYKNALQATNKQDFSIVNAQKSSQPTPQKPTVKRVSPSSTVPKKTPQKTSPPIVQQPTQEPPVQEAPSIEDMYPSGKKSNQVVYRVQLASSPKYIPVHTGVWKKINGVECKRVGKSYKCLVGKYKSMQAAIKGQSYWRKNGFKDAFVVAFRNGVRISTQQAAKY